MTNAVKGFPEKFPVRDDDRRPMRYRTATLLSRITLLVVTRRLRIEGAANIPADGPLLVASNHTSNLDPAVMGSYFPRLLFVMAKRELFSPPPLAWFLAGVNSIPVDRGGADRRAITMALEALRNRRRLLIFVEGTRSHDGAMQRAEAGIGFLARRTGAPVLPVAIIHTVARGTGRPRRLRRRDIVVRYGVPFTLDLAGRRDDRVIAGEIAERIAALLPASRRGVYGDDAAPTEEPTAAGST